MKPEKLITAAGIIICVLLGVCLLGGIIFFPRFVSWYLGLPVLWGNYAGTLVLAFYLTCVPAGIALFCIAQLLLNLGKAAVFVPENVSLCNAIAIACFLAAGAFLLCWLLTLRVRLLLLCGILACLFMGLIVMAVRNLLASAIRIKEENDLTV